jgi:hypothetical protein
MAEKAGVKTIALQVFGENLLGIDPPPRNRN